MKMTISRHHWERTLVFKPLKIFDILFKYIKYRVATEGLNDIKQE